MRFWGLKVGPERGTGSSACSSVMGSVALAELGCRRPDFRPAGYMQYHSLNGMPRYSAPPTHFPLFESLTVPIWSRASRAPVPHLPALARCSPLFSFGIQAVHVAIHLSIYPSIYMTCASVGRRAAGDERSGCASMGRLVPDPRLFSPNPGPLILL